MSDAQTTLFETESDAISAFAPSVVKGRCWYCHEPAIEVWHTTWDEADEAWPMCRSCSSQVRRALAHRAEGRHVEADEIDELSGISTDKNCGQWVAP